MGRNPIDSILEAESEAGAQIDQHREAARETINQAMETARAISARTDRRISNVHSHCSAAVKEQTDALWAAYENEPSLQIEDLATPERLDRIAARVATRLTGGQDA